MKKRLKSIKAGEKQWSAFEDIVVEIIKGCLFPKEISEPYVQVTSPSPNYRRDIILPLTINSSFWHYISIVYGGSLLVVECKNYKNKITPCQVDSTYKYLRRPNVANIGFIFSRKEANPEAFKTAIDIFRTEGKLLLFFDDKDLNNLIDLKSRPAEATDYLRDSYHRQKVKM